MSALTDAQLLAEHDNATELVARYLRSHTTLRPEAVRRASAAQKEIPSRAKHNAQLHAQNYD